MEQQTDQSIGVSHLSPSSDRVVNRSNQGPNTLSPIGSPLPDSPVTKSSLYDNVPSYHLFGNSHKSAPDMIVVGHSPGRHSHLKKWENPMISSKQEEYNYRNFGNIIPSSRHLEVSDDINVDPFTYQTANMSISSDIWQSPNTPPLTPPLRPSPPILSPLLTNRKSNLEQGWTSDPLIPHIPMVDQVNNSEEAIKPIWDNEKVIPNFMYREANHAEFLLNRGRNRSISNNRSRSSSGSVSPKFDDDQQLFNRSHPAHLSQPSQIPIRLCETPPASPIAIPRKMSRLPTLVSLNRPRLSSPHPVSRTGGVYTISQPPMQQQPQIYSIWPNDIPSEYAVSSPALHLLPHPMPYPSYSRPIHFVTEDDLSDIGKIRSRSLGDGKGDKINLSQKFRNKKMTRPRKSSTTNEDLARYELDVNRVLYGQDTRTTLMIKNIPNKYDQEMLLEAINLNFKGTYDFFYLPIDFKNKCNVGYAFINFINYISVAQFYQEFNHKKWEKFNSEKVCKITYARIQGKSAFIDHFRNSSLMYEDQACRPLIFHSSGPSIGQLENFPPANISRSRSTSTEQNSTTIPPEQQPQPPTVVNLETEGGAAASVPVPETTPVDPTSTTSTGDSGPTDIPM